MANPEECSSIEPPGENVECPDDEQEKFRSICEPLVDTRGKFSWIVIIGKLQRLNGALRLGVISRVIEFMYMVSDNAICIFIVV